MDKDIFRSELINKYRWAGKIRLVSFLLLFLFSFVMKLIGGYSYLNGAFLLLIFVEAAFNQPYRFFLKRVNINRFQYYQMTTDIIAISWIVYYLGGIEAPVVGLAYYAVILWAGVVSQPRAVFFAVGASSVLYALAVVCGHYGILPRIRYAPYTVSSVQMFSLLLSNVAFMFAFGYFSARSSVVIKDLERKRQQEALKFNHKLIATGYILGDMTHDIINHLASIKAYAQILLVKLKGGGPVSDSVFSPSEALKSIEELESENIKLLTTLSRFAQKRKEKHELCDINQIIDDVILLVSPVARKSNIKVTAELTPELPKIIVDKSQIQEALVILALGAIESIPYTGTVAIRTALSVDKEFIEVTIVDSGVQRQDYLTKITEPFFTADRQGHGLTVGHTIVEELVARHNGILEFKSLDSGSLTLVKFPAI